MCWISSDVARGVAKDRFWDSEFELPPIQTTCRGWDWQANFASGDRFSRGFGVKG